jgi:hypothetical protein
LARSALDLGTMIPSCIEKLGVRCSRMRTSMVLDAFPALKKLEDHSELWADLQYREAKAVIGILRATSFALATLPSSLPVSFL